MTDCHDDRSDNTPQDFNDRKAVFFLAHNPSVEERKKKDKKEGKCLETLGKE